MTPAERIIQNAAARIKAGEKLTIEDRRRVNEAFATLTIGHKG